MKLSVLLFFVLFDCTGRCANRNARNSRESSVEYFTRQRQNITIPIMVHFDSYLTSKLVIEHKLRNRSKLKEISKNILREVEKMFRRPLLNQNIKFKLLDTKFFRNKTGMILMDGNASKYLKSYCQWQGKKKMLHKRWHYSVLLTGLDLYYVHGDKIVRSGTGRGYMGGMCSTFHSCTVLEWKPRNIGFLLAHEIGHSLGISHDGLPGHCLHHEHIMTSKYDPLRHPKTWSACSRRDLDGYLRSTRSWCLRSIPETNFYKTLTNSQNF